jgi:hypothetical protein
MTARLRRSGTVVALERRVADVAVNRRGEPVAMARRGDDDRLARAQASERLAQGEHALADVGLLDGAPGPDVVEQFLLGDHPVRVLHEIDQQVEHRGRQGDGRAVTGQRPARRVEAIGSEDPSSILADGSIHIRRLISLDTFCGFLTSP